MCVISLIGLLKASPCVKYSCVVNFVTVIYIYIITVTVTRGTTRTLLEHT